MTRRVRDPISFEEAARTTKAWRLTYALESAGFVADDLPSEPGPVWALAASAAGVPMPSRKTCTLARALLRHRGRVAAG